MSKKILCPRCKGRKTVIDKEAALFTLGMSILFKFNKDDGRIDCPVCDGKGKLYM
jgi:uncharacterized Zn finger protein (UPF0148 family)